MERELTAHSETLAHFSVSITKFSQEKSVLTIIKKRDMIKNLRSTIMWLTLGTILCASKLSSAHLMDTLIIISSKVEGNHEVDKL